MSIDMDPSLPLLKSAEITKYLRSRDVPLMSLLPFASAILCEGKRKEWNLYFPQKEEWLLEWLVQRLREDDGGALDARCDPEFWKFLLHLLPLSASAYRALKKNNILQLISKTFSEAALLLATISTAGQDRDSEIGTWRVHSILQERPPPLLDSTGQEQMVDQALPRLQDLLKSINRVVLYIQKSMGTGRREGTVVTVLRGTPEVGAQILGSYLETCQLLMRHGTKLEEEWTDTIMNVWRDCAWGNPNFKKLSTTFSTSCLVPTTQLLAALPTTSDLRNKLEQLITEFIFPHEALFPVISGTKLSKPSSKILGPLLEPLRIQKVGLSHIFKVAITSPKNKRKPDPDIVDVIFDSITTTVLEITFSVGAVTDSDAEVIMGLLAVLIDTGTTMSSDTLAKVVDGISNLSQDDRNSVRWGVVEIALKLDFDIFFGQGNEARASRLISALTENNRDEEGVYSVIELLIDGFVKARDLGGFVKAWISELHKDRAHGGVWESDKTARHFARQMENSFLPGQIENILRGAIHNQNWVIIDAVLRGVRREDTEDKVRFLLTRIVEDVFESKIGWRGWRALVRGLQIENGLMQSMQGNALKIMKKSARGATGDDARKMLFVGEVLMDSADIEGQAEVLITAVKAMNSVTKSWDGSVRDICQENLGVALAMSLVGSWVGVLERVPSDVRTGFVDEFMNMAIRNDAVDGNRIITGRTVWWGMLASGATYEYPALKDAVLAALVSKLESSSDKSRDIGTSLTDIQRGKDTLINKGGIDSFEFLLESIAKFPLGAIKRTTREIILDSLIAQNAALEKVRVDGLVRERVKRLIERIWTLGNASSSLARDASGFMSWALGIGGEGKAGRRILRYVFATKEQERSHKFLTNLVELAEREFLRAGKTKIEVVKACELIVEELWRSGEKDSVKKLRNRILNQLRKSIETREIEGDLVGAWRRMWVLDRDQGDTKEALGLAQNIIGSVKTALPKILTVAEHAEKDVQVETAAKVLAETALLLCACSKTAKEAVNTTALVVGVLETPFAQTYRSEVITTYSEMVSSNIDPDIYLQCLEMVVEGCLMLTRNSIVGPGYWEALKILINGAKELEEEELSKKIADCLSTVLSMLTRNLPRVNTVSEFLAVTDCMDVILREKKWAVTQFNIDETLLSVAITSSPSGPQLSPITTNVDQIFPRLCNLSQVILLLHRRRVRGGRYHLVIAALQSLLHCMYKRKAAGERKRSDHGVHPPWLLPPTQSHGNQVVRVKMPEITEKCVDGFNRLLMTFCEPSASSVRNRTRRNIGDSLLSSVRDREKHDVASCLGGLLGEILKGALEGGFDGDITVSINAIFEVLGAERVKGFAKTVDREGRAMLRELWGEYTRVGGGAGEKL